MSPPVDGVLSPVRRGKARVEIPFMGRDFCPGREPDCLKPAGTGVEVSARMYNDSNSLGASVKAVSVFLAFPLAHSLSLSVCVCWSLSVSLPFSLSVSLYL